MARGAVRGLGILRPTSGNRAVILNQSWVVNCTKPNRPTQRSDRASPLSTPAPVLPSPLPSAGLRLCPKGAYTDSLCSCLHSVSP